MTLKNWFVITGVAAALGLGASDALAQGQGQGQGGGRQRGGGGGGNFDPAQMRERMMERTKENLEITSDDEWKAIEPLVTKVREAQFASMSGAGRGMFGGPRRGGGADTQADQQRPRGGGMFGQQMPELAALEKAIEAKASKAELKAAVEKYNAARKAKQAELQTAQEKLRSVLTARQEALATVNGLL